ncbi:hypothetical protein Hypma_015302 [Hypsizygus marmoreus]|uniref:Uncharacterized protein n=1 Tax=Hypsizygus marmoreus TaxID=39966 RepID=A0A369K571_HYPMA|nr:hypothetical protein Hypma_015302 [Hypsizygus marmoreus]
MESQDRTNYYTICMGQRREKYRSRSESRYAPYPPHTSLHKLKVTYLDPAYVEDLVEMIKPRPSGDALAAVLEQEPQRRQGNVVNDEEEQRGVRGVLGMISDFVADLKRAVVGEAE